jgi:hypothetical protein
MFTGSALKLFVTGSLAVGALVVAADNAQARPLRVSPVVWAEMQQRDWTGHAQVVLCKPAIRDVVGRC